MTYGGWQKNSLQESGKNAHLPEMHEITKHFWAAYDFLQRSKLLFGGTKINPPREKSALALAKKFCINKLLVCFQSQYKSFAFAKNYYKGKARAEQLTDVVKVTVNYVTRVSK